MAGLPLGLLPVLGVALTDSGVIAALEETPRTGLVSGSNAAIDAVFA
ncbi:hypothetical protein GCM10011579_050500 [Streptomyces albiflavescens]|uniref:Uncharacterized protein n=1 Tax=Streptomyces albiflavescens TaxID=1623582 RepID=A0A917Y7G7_9ACTN|nr:hypothetical protein [Streptomyces albiflavescens]GGN72901.1 hypothetical protein GCM10011579_050500 [Streptomyces albiflavescens]